MHVTLEEAKRHLQIEAEYEGDDLYIKSLIEASEVVVANHLKYDSLDGVYPVLPLPVKHAILLMVGNLYANRESIAFAQSYRVPLSYEYLLGPYVCYGSIEESIKRN
jgi:hypothetical protein